MELLQQTREIIKICKEQLDDDFLQLHYDVLCHYRPKLNDNFRKNALLSTHLPVDEFETIPKQKKDFMTEAIIEEQKNDIEIQKILKTAE